MSNSYFQFKQFIIRQDRCAMKVTTDASLFGAWVAERVRSRESIGRHRLADGDAGAGSQFSKTKTVLDIGTGTGLLSLMIAQKNELAIDALEIDQDSFEQATENIAASSWSGSIKIFHADARKFIFPSQYDIIISNPPFYEKELKGDDIKKNIAHHDEGLLLPELLSIIRENLEPGGTFYLLLPYKRNEEIKKLLTESELAIRQLVFVRQSTKHDFFRIMLEGKLYTQKNAEILIDEISIMDISPAGTQNQYNPAFVSLLKNYYLHL
ncbi:MAG TPA: methyltransferase [Chitinophagaceae bacterium]|nr:methyltransferase [Chitinophagaceae bacterium]